MIAALGITLGLAILLAVGAVFVLRERTKLLLAADRVDAAWANCQVDVDWLRKLEALRSARQIPSAAVLVEMARAEHALAVETKAYNAAVVAYLVVARPMPASLIARRFGIWPPPAVAAP